MPELALRFLGVPELRLDGVPIHLPRQRSLALLAYLVLSGRPHAREELAAFLSGEDVGSQERKLLRNALTTLAEQLGDYLVADRKTIAFNAALPHHLDRASLDALLDDSVPPEVEKLEWAVAQYDCELLAGLSLRDAPLFESWLVRTREHLRHQLAQIANRLLEHHLKHGNLERGIAVARRLLAIEPWQESLHRQLMRLLARNGQQDAAVAQYALCRAALAADLGVGPNAETTALYERLTAAPFAPRHNLPVPANPLIGREQEVAEIARLLIAPDCRLVTLVGLGGSGKSQVALAVATQFVAPTSLVDDHPFADGCYLVDLSGISGAGSGQDAAVAAERRIAMAIGLALGLVFYGHLDRVEQIGAYLQSKRILLVLDGLERLVAGAEALRRILKDAPGVTILATTRTRLKVPEEHVRHLGRLDLPAGPDMLERAPASRLFLREAQRLNIRLTPVDREHIVAICGLVNGLPLALLIAAGWLGTLSCAQIAHDLERDGGLLKEPTGRQSDRREGIDAIMAFAWRGLPAHERRALRHLAVFNGHFDRMAAEAIGVKLSSLLLLCEHALVERDEAGGYLLHPLVRQYGVEQLARWPTEEAQVRARHATYYANTFVRQAEQRLRTPEAQLGIDVDRANLFAAWEWAATHLDLGVLTRLQIGLARLHQTAGLHREWVEVLDGAVERIRGAHPTAADPSLRVALGWLLTTKANALMCLGDLDSPRPLLSEARQCARAVGMIPLEVRVNLYEAHILHYQGEVPAATESLRQALTLSRAIQDRRLEAEALLSLGLTRSDAGQYAEAETHLSQAEQIYRELGERVTLGRLVVHRSRLYIARAEFARAKVALEQVLPAIRAQENQRAEGWAYVYLGEICGVGLGRHQEADDYFNQAIATAPKTGDLRHEAYTLCSQGLNALHAGDFARADQLLGQSLELGRTVGGPVAIGRALRGLGMLAQARGDQVAAEDLARQALSLAEETGRLAEQAALLILLGRTQEGRGLPTAATSYARAFAIARALGEPALCCDAATGLASVALAEGELSQAAEHANTIVSFLWEQNLNGCGEPGRAALTCYRALRAVRDPRASETLRLGATLLEQRNATLPEAWRARYLAAFPARSELVQLWHEQQVAAAERVIPPPIALFPLTAAYTKETAEASGAW